MAAVRDRLTLVSTACRTVLVLRSAYVALCADLEHPDRLTADAPLDLTLRVRSPNAARRALYEYALWHRALGGPPVPSHRRSVDHITPRDVMILRVADADAAAATQRDIACLIYPSARVGTDWRGRSDAMRSQIRRLIRRARKLADCGWIDFPN